MSVLELIPIILNFKHLHLEKILKILVMMELSLGEGKGDEGGDVGGEGGRG